MSKSYAECLMEIYGAPERLIGIFEKLKNGGNWKGLAANMTYYDDWLAITFAGYFKEVPDEYKYEFLVDVYAHGGDEVSSIRKEIRRARQYGTPELPSELEGQDVITVYRAGDELISKAPYRLSWTTDRARAEWFMVYSGMRKQSDMHLYQAEIKREKVIAYTNIREENEIIQYRGVRGVEEIGNMTYQEVMDKFFKNREKNSKTIHEIEW